MLLWWMLVKYVDALPFSDDRSWTELLPLGTWTAAKPIVDLEFTAKLKVQVKDI